MTEFTFHIPNDFLRRHLEMRASHYETKVMDEQAKFDALKAMNITPDSPGVTSVTALEMELERDKQELSFFLTLATFLPDAGSTELDFEDMHFLQLGHVEQEMFRDYAASTR